MRYIQVTNNGNSAKVLKCIMRDTCSLYLESETDVLKPIKDLNSLVRGFPLISQPEA